MTVQEVLESHTRKQLLAWMAHFAAERPTRQDLYLARIAYEVRLGNQRLKRNRPKLKDYLLDRPAQAPEPAPASVEEASALAKASVLARVRAAGVKVIEKRAGEG